MFFFGKSLRRQILFKPILILSIASVFASSFTTSICETMSVISSFLRTASVSMLEAICPSFPELVLTSVESSGPSCTLVQCSFTTVVFTRPGTSVQEEECCCCCALSILFQRYLWYRPWSFKAFEINSFSISRCHTITIYNRQYRSVSHDCNWLRLPEFQSLILRLWQSYPSLLQSGYPSIS